MTNWQVIKIGLISTDIFEHIQWLTSPYWTAAVSKLEVIQQIKNMQIDLRTLLQQSDVQKNEQTEILSKHGMVFQVQVSTYIITTYNSKNYSMDYCSYWYRL